MPEIQTDPSHDFMGRIVHCVPSQYFMGCDVQAVPSQYFTLPLRTIGAKAIIRPYKPDGFQVLLSVVLSAIVPVAALTQIPKDERPTPVEGVVLVVSCVISAITEAGDATSVQNVPSIAIKPAVLVRPGNTNGNVFVPSSPPATAVPI